jgi:hypothetical protein
MLAIHSASTPAVLVSFVTFDANRRMMFVPESQVAVMPRREGLDRNPANFAVICQQGRSLRSFAVWGKLVEESIPSRLRTASYNGLEAASLMRPITEGLSLRCSATAQSKRRFGRIQLEFVALGIHQFERSLDQQRTTIANKDSDVRHVGFFHRTRTQIIH